CGIGGDALALAAVDLEVTAADADEVTAAIAAFNLTPFPKARVLHARAEDVPLGGIGGAWLDPARRTTSGGTTRRHADAADYSPSLDFAFGLADRLPVGVKLGPGTDRDVIPAGAEAQWVSVDGDVVELGVWLGAVARPGIGRAALVIRDDGAAELTAPADSEDAPTGPLGDYLYEPDGAVIRARLIGDLARANSAWMLSDGIAYLTADAAFETPFARGFRVLDRLPADERQLRQALAARGIGTLEIKKRGVDVDPAALRTRLKLRGDESATIVLTREAGRHVALLVERV
ncbi:MAG TPA: SAM-dependent methyltransferase, partial [Agromyces mariniharenae]|nr:SAM-dependent methyltransferase [Agromyces mariniharenae]